MRKSWKKGIALAVACALVACNSTATGNVANAATKYVSLNKTSLKLAVKKTAKLTVKKKGGVKVKSTTFKSSNAKVASVTKKGVVTGKSEGTSKITVKVKFKKGKKSGSSTLIAKVTVGEVQASATPKTSSGPSRGTTPISSTTNNSSSIVVKPTTTTGASATATAKVTATATPAVKATKTPGAENPEGTEKPEKTTKPTKAPVASEEPEDTDEPTKTPKPTKTPVASEDPEETDAPAKTPKPGDVPEISKDKGYYDDDNSCWTVAGVYDAEDTDDDFLTEYHCGLVQSWSELTANKVITVSGNKITKVDTDKIAGRVLIIPEDIKEIADNAFAGCKKLVWIDGQTFDVKLDKVGKKAFSNCTNLVKFCIKSNEIGDEAFLGCSSLTLGLYIKYADVIGKKAFSGCSLSYVNYLNATKIGAGAFDTENMEISLNYTEIPEGYEEGWFAPDKNIKVYNYDDEVLN